MGDKAVITCALNGVLTDPKQHNVPVTPEQMAREARAAFDAGASVMHVHLRQQEPNKGHLPSWDVERRTEIQQAIREACPGVIINHTDRHRRARLSGRARLRARDAARDRGLQRRLAQLPQGQGRQHLGVAADDVRQRGREGAGLSRRHEGSRHACRSSSASTSASCAASACTGRPACIPARSSTTS